MKNAPPHKLSFLKLLTLCALALTSEISFSGTAAHAVTFEFNPVRGTPEEVINGFTAAGNLWSSQFTDDVTINIDISFEPLEPHVPGYIVPLVYVAPYSLIRTALASDITSTDDATGVNNFRGGSALAQLINYTVDNPNGVGSPIPYLDNNGNFNNTFMTITSANAKALGLNTKNLVVILGDNSTRDALILMNSNVPWDFDRSDGISPKDLDFIGSAAHEIGHAMGFLSVVDFIDDPTSIAPSSSEFVNESQIAPTTMDLFRFSIDSIVFGPGVIDLTASTTDEYFSTDSGATKIASFSTGRIHGDGAQAGHWKLASLNPDGSRNRLGIMDPQDGLGELLQISDNDKRLFNVIGWDGADAVPVPEPTSTGGLLVLGTFGIGFLLKRKQK